MKSVGSILQEERKKKEKSIEQINKLTKIPIETLKKIENDNFGKLPPTAFTKGFVRNYAKSLGLDEDKLAAIYRRDWEKKGEKEAPFFKKDKGLGKSFWNPKTTGFIIGGFLVLILAGYLGWQIKEYFSPPKLVVEQPMDGEEISKDEVEVKGGVDKEASLYINDELIDIDESGAFSYSLKIYEGENEIEVKAVDRRGKETVVERKIIR